MKRETCLKIAVIVAVVVFSMQFLPPLQSPITSPIIVTLSQDQPVAYSATKVNELLDGRAAVYSVSDAVAQALILPRAVGAVVFVGHGSPDKVKIGNTVVSWEAFADDNLAALQSNQIYLATCYSQKAAQILKKNYGSDKVILGFKGLVDSDEAAYMISAVITARGHDLNTAQAIVWEMTQVMWGKFETPQKYNHWLLGSSTEQIVRGVWYIKYDSNPIGALTVSYTHPDNYFTHPGYPDLTYIGAQTGAAVEGNNLEAIHIPKSQLDTYNIFYGLAFAFGAGSVSLVFGAAMASLAAGFIAGMIVAAIGLAVVAIIDNLERDEQGGGWEFHQNIYSGFFGLGVDFKFGSSPWFHYAYVWFLGAVVYPIGYGGRDLGFDGM